MKISNGPVMLPWKTLIEIDANKKKARYLQIADSFIKEISSGRLQPGLKLPGSRTLSDQLNVNRKTIIHAYDELIALGWLTNKNSSGTYISKDLPVTKFIPLNQSHGNVSLQIDQIHKSLDFIPDYNFSKTNVVFNGGSPDPRLAPLDWIYKEMRSLGKKSSMKSLFASGALRTAAVIFFLCRRISLRAFG